ncbi:MAG: hypothetical protein JW969_17610 [Spirochaetales bacterium]|nr:hypothetical protein [Spirochaetales bacterium]
MLTKERKKELLEVFEGLRVADVRDGMDWNGMHHYGSLDNGIRPLFRTRAFGIAKTLRYLPYQETVPAMTPDEYTEWVGMYYEKICPYPWIDMIEPGDFIVIDQSGLSAGLMGSNNSLHAFSNGARGLVTNGGVRDTDEIILEQIPFWSRSIAQTMVQGRLKFDAHDIPVSVGGVLVHPGDVVVADGDGVIVVPEKMALDVAKYARRELTADKGQRKKLYEKIGMILDETVI